MDGVGFSNFINEATKQRFLEYEHFKKGVEPAVSIVKNAKELIGQINQVLGNPMERTIQRKL